MQHYYIFLLLVLLTTAATTTTTTNSEAAKTNVKKCLDDISKMCQNIENWKNKALEDMEEEINLSFLII